MADKINPKTLKKTKLPQTRQEVEDWLGLPKDEELEARKQERKALAERVAEKGGELGFPNVGAGAATLVDLSSELMPETREEYTESMLPGAEGSLKLIKGLGKGAKGAGKKAAVKVVEAGEKETKFTPKSSLDDIKQPDPSLEIPDEYLPTEAEMRAKMSGTPVQYHEPMINELSDLLKKDKPSLDDRDVIWRKANDVYGDMSKQLRQELTKTMDAYKDIEGYSVFDPNMVIRHTLKKHPNIQSYPELLEKSKQYMEDVAAEVGVSAKPTLSTKSTTSLPSAAEQKIKSSIDDIGPGTKGKILSKEEQAAQRAYRNKRTMEELKRESARKKAKQVESTPTYSPEPKMKAIEGDSPQLKKDLADQIRALYNKRKSEGTK